MEYTRGNPIRARGRSPMGLIGLHEWICSAQTGDRDHPWIVLRKPWIGRPSTVCAVNPWIGYGLKCGPDRTARTSSRDHWSAARGKVCA